MGTLPAGARLKELRDGLLRLHSSLLVSERELYERDVQRIRSQGQFLELLLNDPAFSWLRELSQLIVLIDEAIETDGGPGPIEAEGLLARARSLLQPADSEGPFGARYLAALQRDPAVVLAHSATMQLLRRL
ncbi:MAG TPA: hypothetical protein VHA11_02925 [Bryobacteraceae bacterium]|nr:hypothetical protein [Bryobacteraceae bacterium]